MRPALALSDLGTRLIRRGCPKITKREIDMRILLVEDDPIIGFAAADALRSEGHEVVGPAATVEDAQHFAGEGADFALVDNLAAHDKGVELARDLKSRFGIASAFVSGQSGAAHSNKDAAVGLLRKPYTAKSLIEATAVIAEIVSGGSPPPLSVPLAFELFA
jgi:DNA-binding response OmpR family regulator